MPKRSLLVRKGSTQSLIWILFPQVRKTWGVEFEISNPWEKQNLLHIFCSYILYIDFMRKAASQRKFPVISATEALMSHSQSPSPQASCSLFVPYGIHGIQQVIPHWLVVWNIFIFPYIGNNHPNRLIFFRGVQTTNQLMLMCNSYGIYWWNHGSDHRKNGIRWN